MKTVDGALAFAERVYSRVSDAGIIAAEVRRLREENERQRFDILAMNQSLDLLREENERLRVQLAGCGVAAMQNTADSREHRIEKDAYGWSASYADVCSAVDREIALREENERLANDMSRCYRMLLSEPDVKGALFKAENILRESLADRGKK